MKKLCIYHGSCFDGFAAAWVVRKALGEENVEFHPGVYGQPPPDIRGRKVIIVDFSYKREVMEHIVDNAAWTTILDHHITAQNDLENLRYSDVVFDMNKSGAGVAWDYYFKDVPRPPLINYVEDRDLWRFALPGSRKVHAALSSYEQDFNIWDVLMVRDIELFVEEGAGIERKHLQDVKTLLPIVTRKMRIAGELVPIANLPMTMTSDAGNMLAEENPFGGCYWDTPEGRVFSLRSRKDSGVDVSAIAAQYGGGGHVNAAGFRMPHGWEGE